MRTDILFENFEVLADAPNGVPKLREFILQMAVQGKLVPQDPSDLPASALLGKIKAEKNRLIKEKKKKNIKPLPYIELDEVPFELPEGWVWLRLNDVFDVRDGTHDTPRYVANGIPLITSKNISGGALDFSNIKYISKEDHKKIKQRSGVDKYDILVAMIGSIGNPVIVDTNREFSIKNVALFKYYALKFSNPQYLHSYLIYATPRMRKDAAGAVQPFLSLKFLRNFPFPMPPLREQKRIVAKIDQLMALCDELEARKKKRKETRVALNDTALHTLLNAENNNEFSKSWLRIASNFDLLYDTPETVNRLRQAILQLAVQGKLVPQDPKDLPAPRPGVWFVYALECEDRSIYIGQTPDILKRWKQHTTGRGADWTKRHPPVKLVHWEDYDSLEKAVKREKELKTGFGRKWLKREYIAGRTRQAGEPASVLLDKIQTEKERLIKENKIKRTKPLPPIESNEELIELPESWKWARLGSISEIIMGQSPPGNTYNDLGEGVPLVNGPVEFSNGPFGSTVKSKYTTKPTKFCEKDDLLLCVRGSTTGRTNVAAFKACIGRGVAAIRYRIFQNYLNWFIVSIREYILSIGTGSTFPSISYDKISMLVCPLPPKEEQKRIVAKIDQLMALCDELETKLTQSQNDCDELLSTIINSIENGKHDKQSNKGSKSNNFHNIRAEKDAGVPKSVKETFKSSAPKKSPSQRKKPLKPQARFEKLDVLKAFRKAIFRKDGIDELTLLRLTSQRLGVKRLSQEIREELESYLNIGVRRKVLYRNDDGYCAGAPTIEYYDDDYLIKVLCSVTRKGWEYPREHIVDEAAKYLGFDKPSDAFKDRLKSVFRKAIREGVLYRNGSFVGKS